MVYITRTHLIKCATAYCMEHGTDSYGYKVLSAIIEGMFDKQTESFEYNDFKRLFGTWTTDIFHDSNELI